MEQATPTWGLCATIKAPLRDVLGFVAYHLDLGAHRLFIYLDDPQDPALPVLKAHPKVRVTACDDAWWRKAGRRPKKHQLRQTHNATHAYGRRAEVDWLIHIDVDEFLWPRDGAAGLGTHLAALPAHVKTARVRPVEALAGDATLFKGFIPPGPARAPTVARLYPTYGPYLKGGFISHVAGKPFIRTGQGALVVKIHNVFAGDVMNPGEAELDSLRLCHCHAKSWDDWIAAYRYRLNHGSYRAELAPALARDKGGLSLHELFARIEAENGESGLGAFHDEVCAATPRLIAALQNDALLDRCDLDLDHRIAKHFPTA